MNDLLAALSAAHLGAFTAHDAYTCGYQRQSLRRLVRRGPVLRGLTLMSIPVFGAPLDHLHVARATDSLSRRRPGLSIHTTYGIDAGRLIGRTPSVAPALAILGAAMTCGIETGVVAADAALAAGKTTMDDLQAWLTRLSRHRHVSHARQAVRLAEKRSESVGESRTRLLLHAIGFGPTPQFEIRDPSARLVGRVDFLLERERVIVEFDGLMLHFKGRQRCGRQRARGFGRREVTRGPAASARLRVCPTDVGRPFPTGNGRTPDGAGPCAGLGSARYLRPDWPHSAGPSLIERPRCCSVNDAPALSPHNQTSTHRVSVTRCEGE